MRPLYCRLLTPLKIAELALTKSINDDVYETTKTILFLNNIRTQFSGEKSMTSQFETLCRSLTIQHGNAEFFKSILQENTNTTMQCQLDKSENNTSETEVTNQSCIVFCHVCKHSNTKWSIGRHIEKCILKKDQLKFSSDCGLLFTRPRGVRLHESTTKHKMGQCYVERKIRESQNK